MDIKSEILKSIEIMIEKATEKYKCSDYATTVEEIKGNKYKVKINGAYYWVKDGVNISPTVGTHVWVYAPNNKMSDLYICAKK